MISIDEAIAKQREIAETQRLLYEACILKEQNTHFFKASRRTRTTCRVVGSIESIPSIY